jgi:hypothetical protein
MGLQDSTSRLAARLRDAVEEFSEQELGRAYSHEDFVQQASVSLDLVASECLMFGAAVFDEEQDAPAVRRFENVFPLEVGQGLRSTGGRGAQPSQRSAASIVADYRARRTPSRLKAARKKLWETLQSYPIPVAILMVAAAVAIDAGFRGSMSHLTMVMVLVLAVGLSGLVAGISGVLSAATVAIVGNYVFLQPVFDWPTSCTAKCTMHLVLGAAAICVLVKYRELKILFARSRPFAGHRDGSPMAS